MPAPARPGTPTALPGDTRPGCCRRGHPVSPGTPFCLVCSLPVT